jgi:hypothetical protein
LEYGIRSSQRQDQIGPGLVGSHLYWEEVSLHPIESAEQHPVVKASPVESRVQLWRDKQCGCLMIFTKISSTGPFFGVVGYTGAAVVIFGVIRTSVI